MEIPTSIGAYKRVLNSASTPGWEEFSRISLIAGAGIVLVGLIGFVITISMGAIPGT